MKKEITLTNSAKKAVVDDVDFDLVSRHRWHLSSTGYARRAEKTEDGYDLFRPGRRVIYLHRSLMGLEIGDPRNVDHIDGDTLNNRRLNLRVCTHGENQRNLKSRLNTTSKYKGVAWARSEKKWVAYIRLDRKKKHIGYFVEEVDAALAYNAYATKHWGEFARLNLI